jgi:hypothetical protein
VIPAILDLFASASAAGGAGNFGDAHFGEGGGFQFFDMQGNQLFNVTYSFEHVGELIPEPAFWPVVLLFVFGCFLRTQVHYFRRYLN